MILNSLGCADQTRVSNVGISFHLDQDMTFLNRSLHRFTSFPARVFPERALRMNERDWRILIETSSNFKATTLPYERPPAHRVLRIP
jgi:hypothetical protein